MVRIIFFFLITVFCQKGFSQIQGDTSINLKKTLTEHYNGADIVLGSVKTPPVFPGGKTSWADYLKKNINLSIPLINKAISGTYVVSIRFIVGKEGVLRNIGAETGCGYGMEDEVIKCMKLSPKWEPAQTANKETVSFASRQLVVFNIKGTHIEVEIR